MGSRGLMVEIWTHNRRVASSSLGPGGIVGGGSECPALSPPSIPRRGALEQGIEPPTAPRVPQHKRLPSAAGVCSLLCVHCCVCALWMGKCRARIPSMGHHTWLYVNFQLSYYVNTNFNFGCDYLRLIDLAAPL